MNFLKVFGKYNEYVSYHKNNNYFEIIDEKYDENVSMDIDDLNNLIKALNILKEEIKNNELGI